MKSVSKIEGELIIIGTPTIILVPAAPSYLNYLHVYQRSHVCIV